VEKYREDHVLHNKLIIPTEEYETFAGIEDVGDRLVQMTSSLNLAKVTGPMLGAGGMMGGTTLPGGGDRNMTEAELLNWMTKCIESRDVSSLDFMTVFFRDNTISQTMVKSKARIVWLQDWYPMKDCLYAISIDKEKRRVLVVFRGAITRADWSHGFDAAMKKGPNPVKEDYEGRKAYLKIHRGFYTYLFRTRKDTQTRKYDEIANKVYEYGKKMIGDDFTVTVNGYSLGGALSVLFGFYASTDERLTRNGPVKIFSYGMPYAGSHSFADAFRHQEKTRKLQHARFYNSDDLVAHLPFNGTVTKRGSNFVHVGIDVKLYAVPGAASLRGSRYPRFHYNDRQSPMAAYWRAIKLNSFLNMPLPWLIKTKHGLPELQDRIARAILVAEREARQETSQRTKNPYLISTLDEAYEAMVHKNQN
jgi:predicted lipase